MKCFVPAILLGCAILSSASAQQVQARFTAGATIYADDGSITEPAVGGGVRYYFSQRWSVEPEFIHTRSSSNFSKSRNYNLWGSVAYDFRDRDKRVVPYGYGGPGLIRHTTEFGQFSNSTVEAGFGAGAGVRWMLSDRVFMSPQFRLGLADAEFFEITFSLGFLLRK